MSKVTKSFSLDVDDDRDLVSYLDALPRGEGSGIIRAALRAYLAERGAAVTLGDVYAAIVRIEGKLEQGVTVVTAADKAQSDKGDAPGTAEAAANLDAWSK